MSFGSFLRGIVASITPSFIDHGQSYGTFNPPQRKRPDQPVVAQTPTVNPVNLTNNIPNTRTPLSFGTLTKPTQVSVPKAYNTASPTTSPVQPNPVPKPVVNAQNITTIGQQTPSWQQINKGTKQYTPQNEPARFKVINTGADIAANVASGVGEGVSKLVGSPLSLASFVARKVGAPKGAAAIDRVNAPSRIGNSIAAARKEVDVAAKNEGYNLPYKVGSVVGSVATILPAAAEGVTKLGEVPTVVRNLPRTAKTLRTAGKAAGGEIFPKVRRFFRGNPAEDTAAIASSTGEVGSDVTQIPVSQPTDIPVQNPTPNTVTVPVRTSRTNPLIKEVTGDASTPETAANSLADRRSKQLSDRFDSQTQPNKTISDVTPPSQTPYASTAEINAERDALDKALANKEITKAEHKAANKELDQTPTFDKQPGAGTPIAVKQINPIDVNSVENVPANLPETPGKVRVTTTKAPVQAQSEAIAAQAPPAPVETPSGVAQAASDTVPKTVDATAPPDPFYQGLAEDLVGNIKQAAKSNKELKKLVSAQKGERVGAATAAANNASGEAKLRAFFGNLKGQYADNTGYVGSNHSQEVVDRVINDAMSEAEQLGFNRGNTARAFQKVFRAGQTVDGHTVAAPTKSDIRYVKEFLNRRIGGSIGDNLDSAYAELLANVPKKEDFGFLSNLTGLPRVLMTSGDISVSGRQALKLGLQHPIEFAKANARALKYAVNPKSYEQAMSDLRNSDLANFVQDNMKVKLPMLAHTDDAYWGDQWANKIPLVNKFVQASERQYNAVLSDMRLASATKQINKKGGLDEFQNVIFNKAGGDYEKFNKALGKWGDVINNLSGSGDIGGVIAKNPGLASTLFAPRNLAAKFNTFNPVWYAQIAKSNPAAAIYAAKSMGTYLATVGGTLLALKHAGASIELDPRSADFGVIKMGNTRIDFTGGDRTVATFLARMSLGIGKLVDQNLPGDAKNVNTGEITNKTPQSIVGQFLSNKLSPLAGLVNNMLGFKPNKDGTGITDAYGNPLNTNSVWATLANLTVPMTAQDVASAYSDSGSVAKAAGVGVASFLGAGANTYGTTPTKDQTPASIQASDTKAASAQALADFKKSAGEGYGINQLPDGTYVYNINGKVSTTPKLKTAQEAVLKDTFDKSGKNYQIVGDTVMRRAADGTISSTPKIKFDYQMGTATLTKQKNADDLTGWLKTAQSQLDNINQQLQDPAIDPLDALTLQNDAQTISDNMAKYQSYGGFTKGAKYPGGKKMSTSFGTLSSGSNPFAPKVREYQTASMSGTGGIPVIKSIQPNIIHRIGTG